MGDCTRARGQRTVMAPMRVYRDRREKGRPSRPDAAGERAPEGEEDTSSGLKVLRFDKAPVLEIGETGEYDESKILRARRVEPTKAKIMHPRRLKRAKAVGPDGRTDYEAWEERVRREERAKAAKGPMVEVEGAVVQRRFEDFRARCPDCQTTAVCPRCKGKGKVFLLFTCRFCVGSGRCLQCLPVVTRPCPVCGAELSLHASTCFSCGRDFQCPVCRRHLPFESTRCPTCDVQFRCVACREPVAIAYQTHCGSCGGKNAFQMPPPEDD